MTRKIKKKKLPAQHTAPAKHPMPRTSPILIAPPLGGEKYSSIMLRFAEPLITPDIADLDQFDEVIMLAAIAWNIPLIPPAERAAHLAEFYQAVPFLSRLVMKRALNAMMRRKETLFAEYHWYVLDYHVSEIPEGFHLTVLAELGR